VGAPSKLDDLKAKKVVDAVKRGLPRDTAARLANVAPSTLYLWLAKGRAGDEEYSEFSDRVRAAEAQGENEIVALLRGHAANSWQACAWLLERRHPKAWALRKLEAGGVTVTDEEAAKLVAEAAALAK
jgi:transposase